MQTRQQIEYPVIMLSYYEYPCSGNSARYPQRHYITRALSRMPCFWNYQSKMMGEIKSTIPVSVKPPNKSKEVLPASLKKIAISFQEHL